MGACATTNIACGHGSGRAIVVMENSRLVVDADGRALYFEGTITDITQRKAAERALFNEKERAQVTLQSIGDAWSRPTRRATWTT